MRLWSIHPKYLDMKGLIALWREALLAKKVLQNKTKGYKNHPQLIRFKNQSSPVNAINFYLSEIFKESQKRNFKFDIRKIGSIQPVIQIPVSSGQIKYEFDHLLKKLKERDADQYRKLKDQIKIAPHPLFKKVPGAIEKWEKIKS